MKYIGLGLVWHFDGQARKCFDALHKYGLVRGSLKAGWRLLRCNPWSHGGVDYA